MLAYTTGYFQVATSGGGGTYNAALTFVDVHSLSFVGGYLAFYHNSALTLLNLLVLTYVGGFFEVDSNSQLIVLSTPNLLKIAGTCPYCSPQWAVFLGYNANGFSFSSAISSAAAGQQCCLTRSCIDYVTCM